MKRSEINPFILSNGEGMTNAELAEKCGISANAVSIRKSRLGVLFNPDMPETIGEVVEKKSALRKEKDKSKHTAKENKFLYDRIDTLESELDVMKGLDSAISEHVIVPQFGTGESEATAFVLLSDWHIECEVTSASTNGLNVYNLDIASARADECFNKIVRLLRKEQQDVKIVELVLWLGGDFIDGRLREESLETGLLGIMPAAIFVQDLLEAGLKFLLENTKLNITVVTSVGNHSRITHKISAAREQDNAVETMVYHQLASRFNDERIKFIIKDSYHTYLPVYGYMCRFHHGTRVRYMGAMGGIHTNMVKKKLTWDKGIPADFDFLGHHHTYLPVGSGGGYIINGSMIGDTPYGLDFGHQPPKQAFFLIDKKRGLTVTMPILFKR